MKLQETTHLLLAFTGIYAHVYTRTRVSMHTCVQNLKIKLKYLLPVQKKKCTIYKRNEKEQMLRILGKKVNKCFQTHTYPRTPGTQGPSRWVLLYLKYICTYSTDTQQLTSTSRSLGSMHWTKGGGFGREGQLGPLPLLGVTISSDNCWLSDGFYASPSVFSSFISQSSN